VRISWRSSSSGSTGNLEPLCSANLVYPTRFYTKFTLKTSLSVRVPLESAVLYLGLSGLFVQVRI
jgi:hypothetical protein